MEILPVFSYAESFSLKSILKKVEYEIPFSLQTLLSFLNNSFEMRNVMLCSILLLKIILCISHCKTMSYTLSIVNNL